MTITDRTPRADLVEAIRNSGRGVHRSGHPALRAASARAEGDAAFLEACPGDTVGDLRRLAREARDHHQRGVWGFAALGLGLVGAAGALSWAGAPLVALPAMVGGVGCLFRAGLGTDRVSAEELRVGVLDTWVRQLNGGPADSGVAEAGKPPGTARPLPANDREALLGMLADLDTQLVQQAGHPVVGSALAVVRSDRARLAAAPGATLAEMREDANGLQAAYRQRFKRSLVGGLAGWAAGATALALAGGPVGAAGVAGLAAFLGGTALVIRAGLTQDRFHDRDLLEDSLARWEPQMDAWRRQQEAPAEVARLAGGAPAAGEIQVAEDGVRIGSVFVPIHGMTGVAVLNAGSLRPT